MAGTGAEALREPEVSPMTTAAPGLVPKADTVLAASAEETNPAGTL